MKRSDAEQAIRPLVHKWRHDSGQTDVPANELHFSAYRAWLYEAGYGHCLQFRSTMGTDYDAEMWFDEELGQMRRR